MHPSTTPGPVGRRKLRGAVVGMAVLALMVTSAPPTSAFPRPGRTERVSLASDGSQGNGRSEIRAISADGRHVAFGSLAPDLVAGDDNGTWDVFVHDRGTGTTERVSVASDGTEGNDESSTHAISGDGRYVAFQSSASNLVPEDTNGTLDAFVHDRDTGTTERVSVASDGTEGNGQSATRAISGDGRYVAFASSASNLVPADENGAWDVFVYDRDTGTTERVSVASDGTEGTCDHRCRPGDIGDSWDPVISADGRYAAFASLASNLVPGDSNGRRDVFVHDRDTGTTERVSITSDGTEGNSESWFSAISADGRHVAFQSLASNLVPADQNGSWDVFVHDRATGTTERVSVPSDGAEGDRFSLAPAISADGRHVAFGSFAPNLVPADQNGSWDVFVHDRATGTTERVSVASDGTEANGLSFAPGPALSADGGHVAFPSDASNLVPGDTNESQDVFVRHRGRAVGVGELSAVRHGDRIEVSGWATFSGATMASVTDPPEDGGAGAEATGTELTGAELTYRPEREDVLVSLRLSSLPGLAAPAACGVVGCGNTASAGAGSPGILYGLEFDLAGTRHEIRAVPMGATAAPAATPLFALYRCDSGCTEQAQLSGGIGTTGTEVRVSVPLSALEVSETATVKEIRAFTALGEVAPGAVESLDEADLPDATIPARQISLGVASRGTSQETVMFDSKAALTGGDFSGSIDVSNLPLGDYEVWARACLGEACAAASALVPMME